jgi:hypothetical protein
VKKLENFAIPQKFHVNRTLHAPKNALLCLIRPQMSPSSVGGFAHVYERHALSEGRG